MSRDQHLQHWLSAVPAEIPKRRGFFARQRFAFWLWLANITLLSWAITERRWLLVVGQWCLARAFAPEHGLVPVLRSEALHKFDL